MTSRQTSGLVYTVSSLKRTSAQQGLLQESELYQQNQEMVRMLAEEGRRDHQPLTLSSQYATSYWMQSK